MAFTPQRFVHVGFGNVLCANRIETILVPSSASAKRLCKAAKAAKCFFDMTAGRVTKSLILMDDGKVFSCALTPRTIALRVHALGSAESAEGDDEDENRDPVGESDVSH